MSCDLFKTSYISIKFFSFPFFSIDISNTENPNYKTTINVLDAFSVVVHNN